ncbi:hypothetical protein ACFFUZ_24540, partial [Kibdelosporangium philippinense]
PKLIKQIPPDNWWYTGRRFVDEAAEEAGEEFAQGGIADNLAKPGKVDLRNWATGAGIGAVGGGAGSAAGSAGRKTGLKGTHNKNLANGMQSGWAGEIAAGGAGMAVGGSPLDIGFGVVNSTFTDPVMHEVETKAREAIHERQKQAGVHGGEVPPPPTLANPDSLVGTAGPGPTGLVGPASGPPNTTGGSNNQPPSGGASGRGGNGPVGLDGQPVTPPPAPGTGTGTVAPSPGTAPTHQPPLSGGGNGPVGPDGKPITPPPPPGTGPLAPPAPGGRPVAPSVNGPSVSSAGSGGVVGGPTSGPTNLLSGGSPGTAGSAGGPGGTGAVNGGPGAPVNGSVVSGGPGGLSSGGPSGVVGGPVSGPVTLSSGGPGGPGRSSGGSGPVGPAVSSGGLGGTVGAGELSGSSSDPGGSLGGPSAVNGGPGVSGDGPAANAGSSAVTGASGSGPAGVQSPATAEQIGPVAQGPVPTVSHGPVVHSPASLGTTGSEPEGLPGLEGPSGQHAVRVPAATDHLVSDVDDGDVRTLVGDVDDRIATRVDDDGDTATLVDVDISSDKDQLSVEDKQYDQSGVTAQRPRSSAPATPQAATAKVESASTPRPETTTGPRSVTVPETSTLVNAASQNPGTKLESGIAPKTETPGMVDARPTSDGTPHPQTTAPNIENSPKTQTGTEPETAVQVPSVTKLDATAKSDTAATPVTAAKVDTASKADPGTHVETAPTPDTTPATTSLSTAGPTVDITSEPASGTINVVAAAARVDPVREELIRTAERVFGKRREEDVDELLRQADELMLRAGFRPPPHFLTGLDPEQAARLDERNQIRLQVAYRLYQLQQDRDSILSPAQELANQFRRESELPRPIFAAGAGRKQPPDPATSEGEPGPSSRGGETRENTLSTNIRDNNVDLERPGLLPPARPNRAAHVGVSADGTSRWFSADQVWRKEIMTPQNGLAGVTFVKDESPALTNFLTAVDTVDAPVIDVHGQGASVQLTVGERDVLSVDPEVFARLLTDLDLVHDGRAILFSCDAGVTGGVADRGVSEAGTRFPNFALTAPQGHLQFGFVRNKVTGVVRTTALVNADGNGTWVTVGVTGRREVSPPIEALRGPEWTIVPGNWHERVQPAVPQLAGKTHVGTTGTGRTSTNHRFTVGDIWMRALTHQGRTVGVSFIRNYDQDESIEGVLRSGGNPAETLLSRYEWEDQYLKIAPRWRTTTLQVPSPWQADGGLNTTFFVEVHGEDRDVLIHTTTGQELDVTGKVLARLVLGSQIYAEAGGPGKVSTTLLVCTSARRSTRGGVGYDYWSELRAYIPNQLVHSPTAIISVMATGASQYFPGSTPYALFISQGGHWNTYGSDAVRYGIADILQQLPDWPSKYDRVRQHYSSSTGLFSAVDRVHRALTAMWPGLQQETLDFTAAWPVVSSSTEDRQMVWLALIQKLAAERPEVRRVVDTAVNPAGVRVRVPLPEEVWTFLEVAQPDPQAPDDTLVRWAN